MNSQESTTSEATGQRHTNRSLENKTRMTIQGYRCRVGNPQHPFHKLYTDKGFDAVYEAMGLIEDTAAKIKKEVLALYDKHVAGHIYIVTNPAWPEWVKVGMAVHATNRLKDYQTSSPLRNYELAYAYPTEDRRASEKEAHNLVEQHASERRGEWFKIDTQRAVHLLSTIHRSN